MVARQYYAQQFFIIEANEAVYKYLFLQYYFFTNIFITSINSSKKIFEHVTMLRSRVSIHQRKNQMLCIQNSQ
jgi:hypothetical protein